MKTCIPGLWQESQMGLVTSHITEVHTNQGALCHPQKVLVGLAGWWWGYFPENDLMLHDC